ncbi:MurR/RpiR family transcriptional regulator [Fundicoccus culcitae]|uniref:MurR/RpiR family transcriptional regulator n=1 Tax=Fundicoccus culcitae TaxID=2969821 RepID=A0ABY5P3V6_9LACT|nr:MurR/RpiR family transcriptional regulator [Fundicoccus culcitae]UUX33407.1 MurR/RpiR family transcriptional regulator [Fundicoccus culcitae]
MKNYYLTHLLKSKSPLFSETETKLSKHFLELDKELINMTIANVSEVTGVSQTTVFNFVKKLGFSGFQEFKIALATNSTNEVRSSTYTAYSDITDSDSYYTIAQKIVSFNIDSLQGILHSLDELQLENIIKLISGSKTLHFFGQGGSSIVAYDAYHKFLRTKFLCNYIGDSHMQLSYSTKLSKDDCVFVFSHSGQSVHTISLAKVAKESGAKIIGLTGNPTSSMLDYCDEQLIVYSEESKYRTESLTSRILYLTLIDIIYSIIMFMDEGESQLTMDKIRLALKDAKTTDDYIV